VHTFSASYEMVTHLMAPCAQCEASTHVFAVADLPNSLGSLRQNADFRDRALGHLPPLSITQAGKVTVPTKWLALTVPLAADCDSIECIDRYGFEGAKSNKLLAFPLCVTRLQQGFRHVAIRTTTKGDDPASNRSILFVQQEHNTTNGSNRVQEWNSHAFGVRPYCSAVHSCSIARAY
jgi:hypothetical protein